MLVPTRHLVAAHADNSNDSEALAEQAETSIKAGWAQVRGTIANIQAAYHTYIQDSTHDLAHAK